jgi:hypothetical protein
MCGQQERSRKVFLPLCGLRSSKWQTLRRHPFWGKYNPKNGSSSSMRKTILLVSRDEQLKNVRALALRRGGYHTISSGNITSALQLATHCQMSIICETFRWEEQNSFIDRVHESNPGVFLLCIRVAMTQPHELLKTVNGCFNAQPGGSRICVIESNNLIAWPRKAS